MISLFNKMLTRNKLPAVNRVPEIQRIVCKFLRVPAHQIVPPRLQDANLCEEGLVPAPALSIVDAGVSAIRLVRRLEDKDE